MAKEVLVWLSINDIVRVTGKSACWVRRAIKSGRLATAELTDIGNGQSKWIVEEAEALAYFSGTRKGGRSDGRRKTVVYILPGSEEEAGLEALCSGNDGMSWEFAYKPS